MPSREQRRTSVCADCQRDRRIEGRGLCCACYYRNRVHGTLLRFPRTTRRGLELVEDYQFLVRQGYTRAHAAERLGVTKDALEKAIERHRSRLAEAS